MTFYIFGCIMAAVIIVEIWCIVTGELGG